MKRIDASAARNIVFMWAIALFVFAGPLYKEYSAAPVLPRAAALVFALLLIAFIPLIFPAKPTALMTPRLSSGRRRAQVWVKLVLMLTVLVLLIAALIALNDAAAPRRGWSNVGLNLSVILVLAVFVYDVWKSIRVLKRSN